MNLILTKECSKRCSFCFTGEFSKETEMSLEFIEKVIGQFNTKDAHFKLLGGEPTQHSQFSNIINLLDRYHVSYSLISNLLFSNSTRTSILGSNIESILCNGMELDKKNRLKVFSKNWKRLRKSVPYLSLAITLDQQSTLDYFSKYLKYLLKELEYIPYIRIGYDLSGKYLLNNTYLGDIIMGIRDASPLSKITWDCQVPPCTLNVSTFKVIQGDNITELFSCKYTPLDVFHDGSAIFCYPESSLKVPNIFKYRDMGDLLKHFRQLYKQKEKVTSIPNECTNCDYYNSNECNSLCLGCLKENPSQYVVLKNTS